MDINSTKRPTRFNSRTLGRVRQRGTEDCSTSPVVSIHAPWEGCDSRASDVSQLPYSVSIHAPWEGCDTDLFIPDALDYEFQFTHPGKGATVAFYLRSHSFPRFNSRTLGRVRHDLRQPIGYVLRVSIHAPWEGCDKRLKQETLHRASFNSRTLGRVRLSIAVIPHTFRKSFNSRTLGRVRRETE